MNFWCNIGFRLKGIHDSELYNTTEQNCISQVKIWMDVAKIWMEVQFHPNIILHHPQNSDSTGASTLSN